MLTRVILLLALLMPMSANADLFCTGKLEKLAVKREGIVWVRGPGGLPDTYLCSMVVKENEVEPEACKAIYSTLLTAQAQKKDISITFYSNVSSCASVPSWAYATHFNWVVIDN